MQESDNPVVTAVARLVREMGADEEALLVGVSGGADSVALLLALRCLRSDGKAPVIVAHLDHGLRPESAADAEWVARLAGSCEFHSVIERLNISEQAAQTGRGIEETARQGRFDLFRRVAAEHECRFVAVAHTADDQAETILHHLLRGTGLAGLRGMPASRALGERLTLIRPLLGVARADVVAYLDALKQPYLTDQSNLDEQFTRNRLRHTLLPLLRDQFNPRVSESLCRLGEQARDVQMILESLANELLMSAITNRDADRVTLSVTTLKTEPRHVVREVLRLLFVGQDWPRGRIRFEDWDQLAALAQTTQPAKSLTLPAGITASTRRGMLTIERM